MTDTVILCGGKGTRAYPHTVDVPKPLLEVARRPVLRHVMELYAAQGHTRFVLAAGYKAESIEEFASTVPTDWKVDVVDTGVDTNTGERLRRCRERVGDPFFATYADGFGERRPGCARVLPPRPRGSGHAHDRAAAIALRHDRVRR